MENFLYGLKAIFKEFGFLAQEAAQQQLFWGFGLGFLVATIIHGFLITDHPKEVPRLLFGDAAKNFERLHQKADSGAYQVSYHDFVKRSNRVKGIFAFSASMMLMLAIVALLIF